MKKLHLIFLFLFCLLLTNNNVFSGFVGNKPKLVLPLGHINRVWDVSFSHDGKYIVTSSEDKTIKIWETATGKLIRSIEGHTSTPYHAIFSSDGTYIISWSETDLIIWETKTWNIVLDYKIPYKFRILKICPYNKYFISSSIDKGIVEIRDIKTGKILYNLEGHIDRVQETSFSFDGKIFITKSDFDSIGKIWDTESWKLLDNFELNGFKYNLLSRFNSKCFLTIKSDSINIRESLTGILKYTLQGYCQDSNSLSPDSKYIVTFNDSSGIIWDIDTGILLHNLNRYPYRILSASFNPDGKYIITSSSDSTLNIWDALNGTHLYDLNGIYSHWISPNGKYIITLNYKGIIQSWETINGELINSLYPDEYYDYFNITDIDEYEYNIEYSPDGKYAILSINDKSFNKLLCLGLWEIGIGKKIQNFNGPINSIHSVSLSPDGKFIISKNKDSSLEIWELSSGKPLFTINDSNFYIKFYKFSSNGKYIITLNSNNTLKVWETEKKGNIFQSLELEGNIHSASFNSDCNFIIVGSSRGAKIYEIISGRIIRTIEDSISIKSAAFSPNGKFILTSGLRSFSPKIWESTTGKHIRTLDNHSGLFKFTSFTPDGKYVISSLYDGTLKIWDTYTGKEISSNFISGSFFLNWRYLVMRNSSSFEILNIDTVQKFIVNCEADSSDYTRFSSDGKYKAFVNPLRKTKKDSIKSIKLYNLETGNVLCSIISVDCTDWLHLTPNGFFDASEEGMKSLYYIAGREPVELDQFNKDIFWKPGLFKKVMGFDVDTLPAKQPLNDIYLYPEIELIPPTKDNLTLGIKLRNQGGGYGKVPVWIDDKEVTDDARFEEAAKVFINSKQIKLKPDDKLFETLSCDELYIEIPLPENRITPGEENKIEVSAWNFENFIRSRRQSVYYVAPRIDNYRQPHIFAVSIGVSDYQGSELDLKFADKDAEEISEALKIGGKNLIDSLKGKYHQYLLTSPLKPNSISATKENIIKVFKSIADSALPSDILTIYLSGHGINYGNEFYFLTADAEKMVDVESSERRSLVALSSSELFTLIKKIPAKKVVMMIDACCSGKIMESEDLIAMKSVDESQIKAIERMKDRGGIHVISGCSADQSSYEATRFGQGILTYTLLEGLKGAALKDESYIDINKLLDYAADRVPVLAEGIGGIQKPQTAYHRDARSFDIGILKQVDKDKIHLPLEKPLFVRSSIQEEKEMYDYLDLTTLLDSELNQQTARGTNAPIVFIDVKKFSEAYKIVGRYSVDGDNITIKINLIHEKRKFEQIEIKGNKNNKQELINKIIDKIFEKI